MDIREASRRGDYPSGNPGGRKAATIALLIAIAFSVIRTSARRRLGAWPRIPRLVLARAAEHSVAPQRRSISPRYCISRPLL